ERPAEVAGTMCMSVIRSRHKTLSLSDHLQGQRDTLAAADAERDDAALESVALHRMQQPRGKYRAAGADRMAVGDGAAFDVDDVLGEADFAKAGEGDRRECLVDF